MAITPLQQERADWLRELLENRDMDRDQVIEITGWSVSQFCKTVQVLRDHFAAQDDTISVIAEPQGSGDCWRYGLRGGPYLLDPTETEWSANRLRYLDRAVLTFVNFLIPAVNGSDGRTVTGRKARKYLLHLRRALEDVALIDDEMG